MRLRRYYVIFVATTKNMVRLNPTVVTQLTLLTTKNTACIVYEVRYTGRTS